MSPNEAWRMIEDAESGETPVSYTRKRSRRGLLVLLLIAAAVVSGAAGGALHGLLSGSWSDPSPWVTGAIIGAGAAFAAGVAQPWGERRRAEQARTQRNA